MQIRPFRFGDEMALADVFHSAVHHIAKKDYTQAQLHAWSPEVFDAQRWIARMRGINPYVVEDGERIVAYADVQSSGYIDHFFVSAPVAGRGVGTLLMKHLLAVAAAKSIPVLTSDVSLTAQPFFRKFGFTIEEQNTVVIGDVTLSNARMRKDLAPR
jgi:putative acetyltransferase